MHLRQPGLMYSACGPLTKNKQRTQNFKETGDSRYIYRNELDKSCFQHDMTYGDFKDEILREKTFNIAKKTENMMDINANLLQWFIKFLIEKIFRL